MPERSVFISKSTYPYFEEVRVAIDWFGSFAMSLKRKCQIGIHQNFLAKYPDRKVLEISSVLKKATEKWKVLVSIDSIDNMAIA